MKFPGVYFAYAALMGIFGESTHGIHYGIALVTCLTALMTFLIGRKLFGPVAGLIAAASFVFLSLTATLLGLAGHATHFVALFATLGAWCLMTARENKLRSWFLYAGLAFGIAVLMKQHAIFFIPLGLLWIVLAQRNDKSSDKSAARNAFVFLIGSITPLIGVFIALLWSGVAGQFYFWTLKYASSYVSINTFQSAGQNFINEFTPIFKATWAFWILGVIGLFLLLRRRRKEYSLWLAVILFLGGILSVIPGFYFRNHYFLAALPGLALLNGALLTTRDPKSAQTRIAYWPIILICLAMLTTAYANRAFWFQLSPDQVSRRLYGINPFVESPPIAEFLRANTSPTNTIAVLGSEPQIYFLANRHSATGYIYTYALTEANDLSQQMREQFIQEIETNKPLFVVYVNLVDSWMATQDRERSVLNWWQDYSKNYRLVGAVDEFPDAPSKYYWNTQLNDRTNPSPFGILIFQRAD
jgi:hypothetical protein